MAKDFINGVTTLALMESGVRIKFKEMEYISGPMAESIKDLGKIT